MWIQHNRLICRPALLIVLVFFIEFCFKNLPVYMWPQRGVFMLQDKPCELIRDSWGLRSFYNYRLISKFNVKCVLASLIRSYKALFNLCISSYHFHYSHPQPIIADRTFQDRWPIIKVKEFFFGLHVTVKNAALVAPFPTLKRSLNLVGTCLEKCWGYSLW